MIPSTKINTLSYWKPSRIKACLFLIILITVLATIARYHNVIEVEVLTLKFIRTQSLFHSAPPNQCGHNNGSWVNFTSRTFRLYAYSAFYDDRPSLLSSPVVRIIAISDDYEARRKLSLYCVLHHGDSNVTVLRMEENPRPVGFGWPLNRRQAKEYVYTCPTVSGLIPSSLSISVSQSGNVTSSSCLPVTFPNKPQQKRDFGVCVQVAFEKLDPIRLIEWLEILKTLGVSLVGVYDLSVTEAGLKVLRHYASEGFVDLHKTNAIYENDDRHYFLQGSPVINDCIYRHMYEFRRIAIIDFDEIIIPRKHKDLLELVSYLDQNSPRINYVFRNNYFFLDFQPDDTISSNFTVLRFRKRVLVSPEGYSVKSLINPQACTHMHNHYCWGLTANYSRHEGNTGSVDPEIGLNQHYKKCHFSEDECHTQMQNVTQDDVMLRFKDVVIERVNEKLRTIMV